MTMATYSFLPWLRQGDDRSVDVDVIKICPGPFQIVLNGVGQGVVPQNLSQGVSNL
jgi:hypothetical protein